jgi:hypothetical protein
MGLAWADGWVAWLADAPLWVHAFGGTLVGIALALAVPVGIIERRRRNVLRMIAASRGTLRRQAYAAATALLAGVLERGECEPRALEAFDRASAHAPLLFDADTAEYLATLRDRLLEAHRMRSILITPGPGALRPRARERWQELMDWLRRQREPLERRLQAYL